MSFPNIAFRFMGISARRQELAQQAADLRNSISIQNTDTNKNAQTEQILPQDKQIELLSNIQNDDIKNQLEHNMELLAAKNKALFNFN